MDRHRSSDDDATGFAGWLYADLLLGLVIVFMGATTVLLVGSTAGDATGVVTNKPLATTTTLSNSTSTSIPSKRVKRFHKVPLEVTFFPQDTQRLKDRIDEFIESEGLAGEPEVALVLLFGRVAANENQEIGAARASKAWPKLIAALPEVFSERALMRPLNSRYLSAGQFSAEIFFQYFDVVAENQ